MNKKATIVISVAIFVIASCSIIYACQDSEQTSGSVRMSMDEIIGHLEDGSIVAGSDFNAAHYSKPWCNPGGYDDVKIGNYAYILRDRTRVLTLYYKQQKLYGAYLVMAPPKTTEVWYFCDMELLAEHMAIVNEHYE